MGSGEEKLTGDGASVPRHFARQLQCHPAPEEHVLADRCQLRRACRESSRRVGLPHAAPRAAALLCHEREATVHIPRRTRSVIGGSWLSTAAVVALCSSAARATGGTLGTS